LDTAIALLPGIHNISGDRLSNTLFNVSCSENLIFTALDPQVGATIRCSGFTGFVFSHATNLSIRDLTFENCGVFSTQLLWLMALAVDKTVDIDINNVVIRGSKKVGLFIGNSYGNISIVELHLQDNPRHFHFLMNENQRTDPGHNNNMTNEKTYLIMESCSIFLGGNDFGLHIYIVQRTYKVKMQLRNIIVYQNRNRAIYIGLNEMCNGIITIENLTIIESGDSIIYLLSKQRNCKPFGTVLPSVKIDQALFKNCGFSIDTPAGKDTLEPVANHTLTIANTLVQRSNLVMGWKYAGSVIMKNVTIENCTGDRGYFQLCLMIPQLFIKGDFTFSRNAGGISIFTCSSGNSRGGYVELSAGSKIVVDDNIIPSYTYAIGGSAMNVKNSRITLFGGSSLTLNGNTGVKCGGILLQNSTMIFQGKGAVIHCNFSHNRGSSGGALAFYDKSSMIFYGNNTKTRLYFIKNHASMYGGAIYVDDTNYIVRSGDYTYTMEAFIERIGSSLDYPAPLFFTNNTAAVAGNTLFGGRLHKGSLFPVNTEDNPSNIASDPTRVCPCEKSIPNCNLTSVMEKLYPGETYEFEAVAVGQKFGTVPSIAQAQIASAVANNVFQNDAGEIQTSEYTQLTERNCVKLSYTIKSPPQLYHNVTIRTANYNPQKIEALKNVFNIEVLPDMIKVLLTQFNLTVYSKNCPYGFLFDKSTKECICQKALLDQGISCDFRSYDVLKPSHKWVNITTEHHVNYYANNMSDSGVIVYDHCPYDFCRILPNPLPLSLYHPGDQCNYNRSGILCGSCKTNFSLSLGSSVCQQCSKPWMAAIITIGIAFAGLLIVVFLMFLNFTVSIGTINGLIFYANIVQANKIFFFPNDAAKSFLSVFIAWLNLDLGIETCLYDGMDAYAKTWLQFLFPAYIWAIVIIIIVSSHYSTTVSRLSGDNAVQVLATLFLLSYAKLLRVSITIFSSAVLVYPDGYKRRLWLYDGNVNYLQGKHIPLFVAGLCFCF
jgi:predicted outer membrane repeat protein